MCTDVLKEGGLSKVQAHGVLGGGHIGRRIARRAGGDGAAPLTEADVEAYTARMLEATFKVWWECRGEAMARVMASGQRRWYEFWNGDDIVQDLGKAASQAFDRFDPSRGPFNPWARKLMDTELKNAIRANGRNYVKVPDSFDPDGQVTKRRAEPGDPYDLGSRIPRHDYAREDLDRVDDAAWLESLDPESLPEVVRRRIAGETWEEIGPLLDSPLTPATAKKRFERWLKKNERRLRRSYNDSGPS